MNYTATHRFEIVSAPSDPVTNLIFTDTTDFAASSVVLSGIKAALKLTNPNGIVLYANPDLNSPTIAVSDIDYTLGNTYDFGEVLEDVETGYAVPGVYTVEISYEIITPSPEFAFIVHSATQISVLGEFNVNTAGNVTIQGYGTNDGIFSVVSFSIVGGRTFVTLGSALDLGQTQTAGALASIPIKERTGVIQYLPEYNYEYKPLEIEMRSDCDTGQIFFNDNTALLYPTTVDSRLVVLKYPTNTPAPKDDVLFTAAAYVHTDLYTGSWSAVVNRQFVFTIGANTSVGITIAASKSLAVDCSDSFCCISQCFHNLLSRLEYALCHDLNRSQTLLRRTAQVTAKITLAKILRSCGQPGFKTLMESIKKDLSYDGCDCGCGDSGGESQKVVPIFGVASGGDGNATYSITSPNGSIAVVPVVVGDNTNFEIQVSPGLIASLQGLDGNTFLSGSGAPSALAGVNGDFYINTTSQSVFKKVAGVWTFLFNMQGQPGAPGVAGQDGASLGAGLFFPSEPVDGQLHVFTSDTLRRLYEYDADTEEWVVIVALSPGYRNYQNNFEQVPLVPYISGDGETLNYIEGKDVMFRTVSGNAYQVFTIEKKNEDDLSAMNLVPGEEFRFINSGLEPVTFVAVNTADASPTAASLWTSDELNVVVNPAQSMSFKYIGANAGGGASEPSFCFIIVARS